MKQLEDTMYMATEEHAEKDPSKSIRKQTYSQVKLLGQGAYGKAFLVKCSSDSSLAVIKTMYLDFMSKESRHEAYKEAKILEQLDHCNIVRFIEVFRSNKPTPTLNIVMEYADGGDLNRTIKEMAEKKKIFPEEQILDWFTQICLAMKHIHDKKIIHRDLKSGNIFLTKSGMVKLGDFGIAKALTHTSDKAKTVIGTPYYLSPEIIMNKPYSFKSDVWALGVLLYEMCLLKMPFDARSMPMLTIKIIKGEYMPLPKYFSKELRDLVTSMLVVDVNKRPNITEILKTPIVKNRIKSFLSEMKFDKDFSRSIITNYKKMQEKKREKKDKLKIEIPGINNFLAEVRKSTNQIIEIKNPDEEDQSSRQRICNTDVIKGKAPSPNKVKIQNYIDDKSKKQHSKVKISLNKVESSTNSINIDTINYDNVGQVKDFQKPKSQLHYPTHQNFFQKDSKTEINHSNDSTNQVSTRQSTTKPFTPTYRKHNKSESYTIDISAEQDDKRVINKESNSKPTLSKSNSKELSAEKSREILRSVKHSADSENLKQDPVKKKVISIIQDSDMADDYSNKTKIAEFVQQHSKKIMSKNTNSKVVKPKGSISTTINSSNVKADEERSLSKLSEDASRDLKLCNDYHKMLLEYKDLEQDTSTSQSNINLLERKSNNELSLAHSKLEMNNATHNRNKTIDSTDSLDQNKSGYNREFKLQSEKDDSIYPKSQTVQDESKPPLEVKSSKIEKNLPKEETPNDEEDIDDEAALKRTMESLKSLLGKLLYEEVYEIVKKNTPEEYYYIELNEISEIVRTQLGSDFKEEKINHAIDNILEIYKLIFAEREKNNMIDF